jgi:hypothetical protein
VKKPFTAEDAKDAEVRRGIRTIKTMDIDSLRVLCVLRGEEVLYFFTPSAFGMTNQLREKSITNQ